MSKKLVWLLVVLASIAAIAAALLFPQSGVESRKKEGDDGRAAGGSARDAPIAPPPLSAPHSKIQGSERAVAGALPRNPTIEYVQYATAKDYAAYFSERARRRTTAEEKFFMGEALKRCNNWVEPYRSVMRKSFPDKYAFEELPHSERRNVLATMLEQCKGFNGMGLDFPGEAKRLLDQARSEGSRAAIALALPQLRTEDPDAAAKLALDVANSGDAFSISQLWPYLVADRAFDRMGFPRVNIGVMQEAWFVAACDMGLDCGSGSQVQMNLCVNQNVCDGRPYIDYVRLRRLSPDDFELMLAYRSQFLLAFQSGGGERLGIRRASR